MGKEIASVVVGADYVRYRQGPGDGRLSYMLEARPGGFIFVGNGDSAGLRHPRYNFNDGVIPYSQSTSAHRLSIGVGLSWRHPLEPVVHLANEFENAQAGEGLCINLVLDDGSI